MGELRVERLRARYRLHAARPAERARLDELLADLVRSGLASALGEIGAGPAEEICVRSVFVPVRLRLGATDAALVASWGRAISESLRRAVDSGADWVVRYRSRAHALADMAFGVASGDISRAWAWRQLGLWRGPGATVEAAAGELARALLDAPTAIVPVLSAAARAGRLVPLVRRVDPATWIALAAAALVAAGAPPGWAEVGVAGFLPAQAIEERAERVVHRSMLASHLALLAPASETQMPAAAAAAFAVLESDPGSLRGSAGLPVVAAVQRLMRATAPTLQAGSPSEAPQVPRSGSSTAVPPVARPGSPPATTALPVAEHVASAEDHPSEPGSARRNAAMLRPPREAGRAWRTRPRPEDEPHRPPTATRVVHPAGPAAPSAKADQRQPGFPAPSEPSDDVAQGIGPLPAAGWTRAGGLLFLLHLVRDLRLVDRLAEVPALERRPVRWVLHGVALDLLPLEADDPAALAFAGLAPDAPPPRWEEEPPTTEEAAALTDLAGAVVHALVELLERPGEPVGRLLEQVCRRRAEIVADPGWIEVRMSLDEVSLEVRQAGLDLDPGYLPWLGAIVRFAYA